MCSFAPHGTFFARCFTSASSAFAASCPGGMRMLTFARATGTSWFTASCTGGASSASTEMAGIVHMRSVSPPSAISFTPLRALAGTVPLVVVQRGEKARECHERVWERPAEAAAVHRLVEHANLDDARHDT